MWDIFEEVLPFGLLSFFRTKAAKGVKGVVNKASLEPILPEVFPIPDQATELLPMLARS